MTTAAAPRATRSYTCWSVAVLGRVNGSPFTRCPFMGSGVTGCGPAGRAPTGPSTSRSSPVGPLSYASAILLLTVRPPAPEQAHTHTVEVLVEVQPRGLTAAGRQRPATARGRILQV